MRLSRAAVQVVAVLFAVIAAGVTPAYAAGGGGGVAQSLWSVAAGPIVLLLCLASLAVVYLAAASVRKQEGLVNLTHTAANRLAKGSALYTLWGILAELLLVSAGAILANVTHIALLVMFAGLIAVALAGLGACVSAYATGRRLHAELSGGEIDGGRALGQGLTLFFCAVALPVAGWIVIALMAANGVGAVLAAAIQGEPPSAVE